MIVLPVRRKIECYKRTCKAKFNVHCQLLGKEVIQMSSKAKEYSPFPILDQCEHVHIIF